MERAVALKKLRNMLGSKLAWRVNIEAPSKDEREAAKLELPIASKARKDLSEQREARMRALLEADPQYQELTVAYQAAREKYEKLQAICLTNKIDVGTIHMGFFHVKAQGDSWEDVIEKLSSKPREAAA